MTVLGKWVVYVALLATGASALMYFRSATTKASLALPRLLMRVMAVLITLASALLLALLLQHDFSNGYVYSYSDRSLPLYFLVSCFYAGQEGSFLFWALCGAVIALVLQWYMSSRRNEAAVMTVFMAVQALFLLLVAIKSPFRSIVEMFPEAPAGFVSADGRGLNPLLQNFWMVIHPPILFIGFAAMAVPFSLAIAGMWKKDFTVLSGLGFPWVLFSTSVLGLGIMLGAYWAYGVLGWGGYWGWDPVENSSLVPWLTAIALLHTMLAQLRTDRFIRTNFFLASVSFLLVVYSTFLTRSGVLGDASVHAFTDPGAGVYWALLIFLCVIVSVSSALLALRWRAMSSDTGDTLYFSREIALGAGALLLVLSAAVVLFGTSLPILSKIRVEPSFYDATTLPLAVLMSLVIGYSLYMQWEAEDGALTMRKSVGTLGASILLGAALFIAGARNIEGLFLIVASFFALFVNVEIAVKVARGDWRFLGGKFAHVGLALFFLGVVVNGKYGEAQRVVLPAGRPVAALGRTMTYEGSHVQPDGKTAFRIKVVDGVKTFTMLPVMFDAGMQGKMKNPDIRTSWTSDFYVSPLGEEMVSGLTDVGNETYTLRRGQPVSIGSVQATLASFEMNQNMESMVSDGTSMAVGSVLDLTEGPAAEKIMPAVMYKKSGPPEYNAVESRLLKGRVQIVSLHVGAVPGESTVTLAVQRGEPAMTPVLIVDASTKPFINLLWAGTLVMMAGFILSIVKRAKEV